MEFIFKLAFGMAIIDKSVWSILAIHFAPRLLNLYENKPIQLYWKFYDQKMKIFR